MATDDKIILFGPQASNNPALPAETQKTIKSCRDIIQENLPKSFSFFDKLDDTLFNLADKAESNQKQEEYFSAMRQIRIVQADIKKQFSQKIVQDFDNFWQNPSSKPFPRLESSNDDLSPDNELSLLQNADLEEEIAIRRIKTRSKTVCANEIGKLTKRFAHMLKLENSNELVNPFDVDNITEHLKNVISPLEVSLPVKLVIYKQYEKQAVNSLLQLFQTLNKHLIKDGVLPKISYKTKAQPHRPEQYDHNRVQSSQTANLNLPLEEVVDQHIDNAHDQDLFNTLRTLLNQQQIQAHNQYTSAHATEEQLTTIADHQRLLSALSNIQQQNNNVSISDEGSINLPKIRHSLIETLNTDQNANNLNQTLSPLDNDTLDIMDLLFEFILEDKNIPLPMRALLARLQIPMLKIAIADKNFFQQKQHPARSLLNNLAQTATSWTQTKQYTQDPLYKHVDSVVTKLIEGFESDPAIFEQINHDLKQFVNQHQQSIDAVEKLTAETSQGQERVELAKQHVDQVIHELYIEATPVPKVIVSLIEDGWKQSLRLRLLQKGEESDEWQTSLSLIKQLLKSVKPTQSEDERQQRLELIPGLHKEIQAYLQSTPITPNTLAVLLKALQRCHVRILNGDQILENELTHFKANSAPAKTAEEDPIKRVELEMYSSANAIEKVQHLKIGTWIDIQQPGESPRRIKFSWRSNLTNRCLFVTSKGVKAAEWSEQELAAMFEKGEASVLDQSKPLMERALVSMMETVNKA